MRKYENAPKDDWTLKRFIEARDNLWDSEIMIQDYMVL